MIPKQLFFIWFGDVKPDYVDFAIENFRNVNKSFKVDLLRYTVSQIENRESVSKFDHNVYKCLDQILMKNPTQYTKAILEYKKYGRKTLQTLSNIVRLDLLNEYGGIYLDCDTFPLKPFDDGLLDLNNFCSHTFHSHYHDFSLRKKDCHFLGNYKDHKMNHFYECWNHVNVNPYKFLYNSNWNNRRKLFFNCMLDYEEINSEYYIEHYCDGTWKANSENIIRSPICKYDK